MPPPTLLRRILPSVLTLGAVALAQDARPIFDARLTLKPAKLSGAEEDLFKTGIVPAAQKAWRERQLESACAGGPRVRAIDVAPGSFTRPGAAQKAILYVYCEVGHNQDLNGIAIVENGRVAAHLVFEGPSNNAIGALPDIDGNGLAEIVISSGGTNMGQTWGLISITEISGEETTDFGRVNTFLDNCGADESKCAAEASRISVKPGKAPAFFREKFVRQGPSGPWTKTGTLQPLKLDDDDTDYEILK